MNMSSGLAKLGLSRSRRVFFAGLSGGAAEVLWITAYGVVSRIPTLDITRQVVATVSPSLALSESAPVWGVVIHFGLSVILAMAFATTVWVPMEYRFGRYGTLVGAVVLLTIVWAINFLLVLPVVNPSFATLLPWPVTLVSKMLFALAMVTSLNRPVAQGWSMHRLAKGSRRTGPKAVPRLQLPGIHPLLRRVTERRGAAIISMLFLGLVLPANAGLAADESAHRSQVVDGIAVYLGLVPAEIVREHPKGHPEREMHHSGARGQQGYHLLIALFDSTSGARITDATVEAAVTDTKLSGRRIVLEPMTIADALTFGNFVSLPASVPYRIQVWIRRPGAARELMVEFAQQPLLP